MNALRTRHLPFNLRPFLTLPSSRRTYFFDPIFLPAQEALLSLHNITGIPWYLLIPASGFLHTALFRLPNVYFARRYHDKTMHGMLLGATVRARIMRAHGASSNIVETLVPKVVGRLWPKLGLTPDKMNPMKNPANLVAALVSISSWFWSISLFRRLTGGVNMWGERLGEPDASFTTEGALWFQDLTVSDPTWILPIISTGMIVYSWIPKTRGGWMAVFGKEDPKDFNGMSPLRLKLVRLSMIATPMFVAGFDSLTAGSSFFVVSSLLSYRLLVRIGKKDELTGRGFEELNKLLRDSAQSTTEVQRAKPGKVLPWYIP